MSKPPEEGRIWEWRAFGSLPRNIRAQVEGFPVRAGLSRVPDLDIYLISQTSNQNIKLRLLCSRWVLKLKLLLETTQDRIDLYRESLSMVYDLPVAVEPVLETARLLETMLPSRAYEAREVGREELIELFRSASPPVRVVEVPKVRSQFVIERGWIEIADAKFPNVDTQTISIHSHDLKEIEKTLSEFEPLQDLDVMNYVEACRRWG